MYLNSDFETVNIKAAFLQGRQRDRDIFVMLPIEIKEDCYLKVKQTVYRLDDTSRNWYFIVKDDLIRLGCKQSV